MTTPIPQPPGLPILGNIRDVDPSNTWASLKTLAEKYGEIFQINVLGHRIVFVAGAALAEELCDEKRFRKYVGGPIVEIRAAVHDALFTAYDNEPSWGIAHRIIAPKLSPKAVISDFDDMNSLATEMMDKWRRLAASGSNKISPIDELNRLNLEANTHVFFGKRLNCLEGPDHPMLKAMEDSTSEAMKRPNRPGFLNWLLYGGKFNRAIATMRAYAADMVKYRRDNPTERDDCLTAMLEHKDPETGKKLTDTQVIDEIVSMPIGSSTAPCVVATAIYFLQKNPHVIAEARRELDSVLGESGDFTYAHIEQLPYIQGLVRESLRLSFAAPGFNIEPIPNDGAQPVLLGGGKYQIAHNQPVILVLAGVNRDPTVFEDPLAFRPERMVGEAFDKLPAGVKKGFGNGKRACIGRHYAWLWCVIMMVRIVREMDFEMVDPSYELFQDGWFNLRPVNFYVKVKPRAN